MPAWWKRRWKGKAKASSKSSAASETSLRRRPEWAEEVVEGECSLKEKANSFDGVLVGRKVTEISAAETASSVFVFDHPLPRSSVSAPLPSTPLPSTPLTEPGMAAAHGSASASSISSSRSFNDIADLGFYRLWNTVEVAKGRHVSPDSRRDQYVMEDKRRFSSSPILENLWSYDFPVFRGREIHLKGAVRVHTGSPTGKQDDLRSPPHPLPLPPNSPTSLSFSTCSYQTQWKKGKLLGRGSFGHVYLGFGSESGQMCAIKEVTVISGDSYSRESFKQLNQEINLLSKLSHPNIVQYYGSELVDDTLEVYLEYVSGGSIHKLLREYGPFGEPVLRNYTAQILSGLAYLHGRNTVHRDIKGANILVDPNGEVKLADFGMAKHISSYTSIRSFKGSAYWMAPEVIMNGSGYNLSVDIWSLGCTVLEMATSKPPWSQFEGVAAIFKIGNSKDIPDIPDHLTSEAKSFLKLCLQRDPSARPTATQLIDHPFVRDQAALKATKSSIVKDMIRSSSDGSYSAVKGFHINTSVSSYGLGRRVTDPLAHKKSSDLVGVRMNKSLPVSPCSSPLRQFKQCNLSCFSSPTHPIYSPGALTYEPSNYFAGQMRPNP